MIPVFLVAKAGLPTCIFSRWNAGITQGLMWWTSNSAGTLDYSFIGCIEAMTPAKSRVTVTRRPKYAFKGCEGAIQALAPARIIESGLPTEALPVHIAVSKFADGLPLYRQEGIHARDQVEIGRRLMARWMGRVGCEPDIPSDHVPGEFL